MVLCGTPASCQCCTPPASHARVIGLQRCGATLRLRKAARGRGVASTVAAGAATAARVAAWAAAARRAAAGAPRRAAAPRVFQLVEVGAANLSNLDAPVSDEGIGVVGPQLVWVAVAVLARPAADARLGEGEPVGLVRGRRRVQPHHLRLHVVPEREHKDHAPAQRSAHALHAALRREIVRVVEAPLLRQAHLLVDGIAGKAVKILDLGVVDELAVLHVEPPNLHEVSRVCPIVGQELRHDGDGLRGVDLEVGARTVEVLVAKPEVVVITTVFVADALVAAAAIALCFSAALAVGRRVPALEALALQRPLVVASVRREGRGVLVGLPDVHLGAADAPVPLGPPLLLVPTLEIGRALDEFHVVRALRVAVSRAQLCARRVVPLALLAILIHLHEVDGAVHAALQRGRVDIEGELLVQELEHLVVFLVLHHVHSRADCLAGLELQFDAASGLLHAVGVLVVLLGNALERAARSTSLVAVADARIPSRGRARNAVLVLVLPSVVHPAPLGVHGHPLPGGDATP
mmetsp:Transcript_61394/g.190297  ORF Transcript_61394/g.190297 Transcript_61394/m.190297 type:complete len:520 (-) Transcript_61394:182-1741(-)